MKAKRLILLILILLCGIGLTVVVTGGDLNPPVPPVEGTMKTLDQVYSAAVSQNPPVGAADGRWVVAMQVPGCPGSWEHPDYSDHCKVMDLEYSFSTPYNPSSGQITDSSMLSGVSVTKNIDKATPKLGKAFHTGQVLGDVTLKFLRPAPEDEMEEYFTITLFNARIVGFSQRVVHRGGEEYAHLEVVHFIWQRLQWNWHPDSVVEEIEW